MYEDVNMYNTNVTNDYNGNNGDENDNDNRITNNRSNSTNKSNTNKNNNYNIETIGNNVVSKNTIETSTIDNNTVVANIIGTNNTNIVDVNAIDVNTVDVNNDDTSRIDRNIAETNIVYNNTIDSNTINSNTIDSNTIDNNDVINNTVCNIANDTVDNNYVANGSVDNNYIANNSIDNPNIDNNGRNAVSSHTIGDYLVNVNTHKNIGRNIKNNANANKRVFFLVAVHCDQTIMYNTEITQEEAETRAKQSMTGFTIASIDFSNMHTVHYNGLCLRSSWQQLPFEVFQQLKQVFVFRDKFCNQRNFGSLVQAVNSVHSVGTRRMPLCYHTLDSYYRYDCNVDESLTEPMVANEFRTGLDGPESSLVRFNKHYKRIVEFMRNELKRWNKFVTNQSNQPITVYHKLPTSIMNWLPKDIQKVYRGSIRFVYLGDNVSAKYVRTSPHCRYRVNHNVSICEICLIDEYAAQLVNMLRKKQKQKKQKVN